MYYLPKEKNGLCLIPLIIVWKYYHLNMTFPSWQATCPSLGLRHGDGETATSSILGKTEGTIILNVLARQRLLDLHHSKQGPVCIWTHLGSPGLSRSWEGSAPHRRSQVRTCSIRDVTVDECARSLPSQSTAGRQTWPRRRVGCMGCSALRGISK